MPWTLRVRLTTNPLTEHFLPSTPFNPTQSSTDNPPLSTWVTWPGAEIGSEVTIAPTWWLASLGLNRENLWETELAECRVSLRVPRAKIEGALVLDLSGPGQDNPVTQAMVYFSDDAEMVYLNIPTARALGIWRGWVPLQNN